MYVADPPRSTGSPGGRGPREDAKSDFALALGVERVGLISLSHPWVIAFAAIVLMIAAAFGVMRLKVDDSLSQLFRSNTSEFRQYEEVTRRFPSSEFDVLIVVEGKDLLARENLEKLRDLVTDLQLLEGTRGIISIFSARQPPEGGRIPAPLFPDHLPEGAAYHKLIERVTTNEIIRGNLLSEDGSLTLIVLALDPKVAESPSVGDVIDEIHDVANQYLVNSGLKVELSGVPVMQQEIRSAVERDEHTYNAIGFVAGCTIAILFFRHTSFMVMAAGPPLTAILLALGALGWLDFRLNMFLNVMTPLIMVISFSDSNFRCARPTSRGPDKIWRATRRSSHRRAGLRVDPRHGGLLLRGVAILEFRSHRRFWASWAHRDRNRAWRRFAAYAAFRPFAFARRSAVRRQNQSA